MTTTTKSPEDTSQDIVRRIIEEITLHPEQLVITQARLGRSTTLKIQVHRGDMARVIGTGGAHAQAITQLVEMIGLRHGANIKARIIEPEVGEKDKHGKFVPRPDWNSAHVTQLATDIAEAIFEHESRVEVFDGEDLESVVEVVVSSRENRELVQRVGKALAPLFIAIGKANGRLLSINVAPGDIF